MKKDIWNAEDRGKFSAAPEDWGSLYRQAVDSLENLDVPDNMLDRIMAGLEAERGNPSAAEPGKVVLFRKESVPVWKRLPAELADRGVVIVRDFSKYAASLAACLVLGLGILTMNSSAGQQIIGTGPGFLSSLTAERPVEAESPDIQNYRRGETPEDSQVHTGKRDTESSGAGSHDTVKEDSSSKEKEAYSSGTQEHNGINSSGSVSGSGTAEENTSASSSGSSADTSSSGNPEKKNPDKNNKKDAAGGSGGGQAVTTITTTTVEEDVSGNGSGDTTENTTKDTASANTEDSGNDGNGESSAADPETQENNRGEPADNTADDTSGNTEQGSKSDENGKLSILDNAGLIKEVSDYQEMSDSLGYSPAVIPESALQKGWSVSSMEVIWGMTAQIIYSDGTDQVIYRTSAAVSELDSDSGTYAFKNVLEGYTLEGNQEDQILLVSWTIDGQFCSLKFDHEVSAQTALEWAKSVSGQEAGAGQIS